MRSENFDRKCMNVVTFQWISFSKSQKMLWRAHIFMVPGEKKLRQISTQFVRGSTFHTSTVRNHSQFYIEFLQLTQVHLCIFV